MAPRLFWKRYQKYNSKRVTNQAASRATGNASSNLFGGKTISLQSILVPNTPHVFVIYKYRIYSWIFSLQDTCSNEFHELSLHSIQKQCILRASFFVLVTCHSTNNKQWHKIHISSNVSAVGWEETSLLSIFYNHFIFTAPLTNCICPINLKTPAHTSTLIIGTSKLKRRVFIGTQKHHKRHHHL